MTLLDTISIFVVIANLALGLFVFIKGSKKKANIFFFLLTIAIAGWVFTNWLTYFLLEYKYIEIYGRLTYMFSELIVPLFFTFVYLFPKTILSKRLLIVRAGLLLSWLFGIIFLILSTFTYYIQAKPILIRPHLVTSDQGILYPFFYAYFLIFIICSFILLFKKYLIFTGIEKQKIKFVLLGFGIAALFGTIGNLILESSLSNLALRANASLLGPLFTVVMVAFISYAIVRYRLMDIKVVIRKSVVHILSFVILLFVYIYLLIYFQKYLTEQYQWPEQTATIVLVLLIVLTIEPLRRFLFRTIDQAFYAKKKEARLEAKKLKLILSSTWQFNDLISKIAKEIRSFFEVKDTQFLLNNQKTGQLETYWPDNAKKVNFAFSDPLFEYIRNKPEILVTEEIPYLLEDASAAETELLKRIEKRLKELNIGLVWPIGERDELVGIFLLGEKEKKEAFTSDNLDYLAKYHSQATMALANALLYKQAVERIATMKR